MKPRSDIGYPRPVKIPTSITTLSLSSLNPAALGQRRRFVSIRARRKSLLCSADKDPPEQLTSSTPTPSGPVEASESQPRFSVSDPVQTIAWGGRLPSKRRAIVGGLSGLGIALVGNLGGLASGLLALDGGTLAGQLGLDVLYPVLGYKRCYDAGNGYELLYPAAWLADQQLFNRYARRIEQQNSLDPPPLSRQGRREMTDPTAAYGPPGGSGEVNVSVVVAPILPGFKLESLGSPGEAAQRFLDTIVAPEGSGRQARLLSATERRDEAGMLYYTQEFTVKAPTFFRHNISVYAARGTLLYTLNAQAPQEQWREYERGLIRAAESFRLIPRPGSGFPQRL
eukprot:jgi/Botrbrau1/20561/Bobra.145_2s0108.1